MIFERHDEFDLPPDCQTAGEYDDSHIAISVWFSDPDLVAFVQQTSPGPVYYGNISLVETWDGTTITQDWTWGIPGAAESSLSFREFGEDSQPTVSVHRYAWWSDGAVTFLDLDQTAHIRSVQGAVTPGTMSAPMSYPQYAPNPYLGRGTLMAPVELSGKMLRFGDFECTKPL